MRKIRGSLIILMSVLFAMFTLTGCFAEEGYTIDMEDDVKKYISIASELSKEINKENIGNKPWVRSINMKIHKLNAQGDKIKETEVYEGYEEIHEDIKMRIDDANKAGDVITKIIEKADSKNEFKKYSKEFNEAKQVLEDTKKFLKLDIDAINEKYDES